MSIDILSALASSVGLAALAGAFIASVFILIPPARAWFVALSADEQSALTAWLIVALAAIAILTSCAGVFSVVVCTSAGILDYVGQTVIVALAGVVGNRAVFQLARIRAARKTDASAKGLELAAPEQAPDRAKLLSR